MTTLQVSKAPFRNAHGRDPRGRGNWWFRLSAPGHGNRSDEFCAGPDRAFTDALNDAKDEARKHGWTKVEVLS